MPPSCPGCGASIGTSKSGVHLFGCGYSGDYEDSKKNRKSRWNRGQQRQMLAEALDAVGLDPQLAGELLDVLRRDAENKGKQGEGE
ncbi:MAG: hypothetical protein V3W28_07285 [Thermoplasmata archaeon]